MSRPTARARFLMSPPAGFGVHHICNPWLKWHEAVDVARAFSQWERLHDHIDEAGGAVAVMTATGRSGALTFTRDTAVVIAEGRAVVLHNVGQRGELEPRHVAAWLRSDGFETEELPDGQRLDGGNVLAVPDGWLIGIPPGAAPDAARGLASRLRRGLLMGVPLAQPRFGHLDLVLADLAGRGWLAHPAGLVDATMKGPAWEIVLAGRPVITVDEDEAEHLACNVITIGDVVIGGGLSPRLCRAIQRLGLHPVPVDLDEFRKAGGGAHCLTLPLTA